MKGGAEPERAPHSERGSNLTRSRFTLPGIMAVAVPPHAQGKPTSTWVSLPGLAAFPDTTYSRPHRAHTQGRSKSGMRKYSLDP